MESGGQRRGHPSRSCRKLPAYSPPSDFRVNVEAGLRTALSLGLTLLWLRFGPFQGGLSFFAGVTATVCVGNSAGQTISRSLMMTHGALIGAFCAILPRWLMTWGAFPAGAGFFVAIFLVLRSRRLTSLGKKFGCVGVTIVVLGRMSSEGLTVEWWRFASSFVRVNVEGGFFALVASLLPYPRFATRDGALRAQFMCRSLSAAVDACVTGFIKARDETSISRARLLCLQVRQDLGIVRMELRWSRLELGLLCFGFCAGGMRSADALEELSELMEEVLQGVRGMRQSMLDMGRTRAQASFARVVGSALRGLSAAVDDTLEATSRRSALLPASILACCHGDRHTTPVAPLGDDTRDTGGTDESVNSGTANASTTTTINERNKVTAVADSRGSKADVDEEKGLRSPPPARRLSSLRETTERLEDAVARVMKDYQRARKEVLYGLDDLGRPLEEAAAARGAGGFGGGRLWSSQPREPLPPKNLPNLALRDFSATNARDGPGTATTTPSPGLGDTMAGLGDGGGGDVSGRDVNPLADMPNHVLVMRERQKLGGSATMARGAFLFSLSGLCAALAKERVSHTVGWRASHSGEAARYVLSGLWKAIRPPPGLLAAAFSTGQMVGGWRRLCGSCCCCGDNSLRSRRRRRNEARAALKRLGGGGLGLGVEVGQRSKDNVKAEAGVRDKDKGRLAAVARSEYFWCFKVSVALTLCAVFTLSPLLAELFDPPLWIAVTAAFVMENHSASAITTCLLRLVGTVLGAVYGVLAAKLSNQPEDESFSFQAHAILLPWVAITCFFRNSSQFSYAALVAGFTAVVIFTGGNTVLGANGEAVSLARIVNTVVGSVIYLFVDMLLVPTRAKDLVLEQVYISLDAAFQEISINGERMFGPVVCPRDSRARFLRTLNRSRSRSRSIHSLGSGKFPPPPLALPPRPAPPSSGGGDGDGLHRRGEEIQQQWHNSEGVEGGLGEEGAPPAAAEGAAAAAGGGGGGGGGGGPVPGSWGWLPSVGQLLPGFSSEKPGFLVEAFSSERLTSSTHRRAAVSRPHEKEDGGQDTPHERGDVDKDRDDRGVQNEGEKVVDVDVDDDCEGDRGSARVSREGEETRAGSRREAGTAETAAASATATSWGGRRKEAGCIRKMVGALALQKHFLPLAELEPQLWYAPFQASAYQGMVAAQEELLRALTLLTKAAIAVSEDRSTTWRQELAELGSHLASLVQLLKIALEDARDVFGGGDLPKSFSHRNSCEYDDSVDEDGDGDGDDGSEGQGMRMLSVQAEAMRLNADVQSEFVMFIQAFIDRGAFPAWELDSILRISAALVSVMGVQRALLTLGHAVATVIDRESSGSPALFFKLIQKAGSAAQVAKRKNFNKEQREEVIRYLLAGSKNGVLWYGAFKEAGEKFGCYWETIKRLWMRYDTQHKAGVSSPQIENRRKGNSGRKGIPLEELKERLQDIPLNDRTTQRGLAAALGIPKSTLHRNLKALGLRAHSNALKPYLTPDGKLERLRWALRWVRSAAGGTRVFHDFEDFVHVDEKWFYLYTDGQKFYLYDDEIPPVRKVQSKRFITKVMFLAAVARPRHDPNLNAAFNGKVGMWAFTEKVPAVRNSRNRAAGTLVTKCVEVTKETYKAKLIDEVIPAIKEKWPAATRYNPIFLQQDNARPHLITNDADVLEACASDGFDIRLCNQPPNSPDTNILDLGFFASIQSLQDRCKPRTIDDLVGEVRTAWEKASPDKLGKVWTSLQACLEQTLLCGGDNTYKVPHLSKDKAARAGTPIPRRYQISEDAWIKGISSLAAGEGQGGAA
eukprot:g11961.t1